MQLRRDRRWAAAAGYAAAASDLRSGRYSKQLKEEAVKVSRTHAVCSSPRRFKTRTTRTASYSPSSGPTRVLMNVIRTRNFGNGPDSHSLGILDEMHERPADSTSGIMCSVCALQERSQTAPAPASPKTATRTMPVVVVMGRTFQGSAGRPATNTVSTPGNIILGFAVQTVLTNL